MRRLWPRSTQKGWTYRTIHARARINQFGIQYVSEPLHRKLFPTTPPQAYLTPNNPNMVDIAREHLRHNGLLGKKTLLSDPLEIPNFPRLVGSSLDEHFHQLGTWQSQPYLSMAETFFASSLPPKPSNWVFESGWTRYEKGKAPEKVEYPLEDALVFDVETLYKVSHYPIMATCVSDKAWYGWVSPHLTGGERELISFGFSSPKLLVGYNVSFDRARVLEEYSMKSSSAFYLDVMALHVAVAGICSQQRISWQQHRKISESQDTMDASEAHQQLVDDPWLEKGSLNSLAAVAEFHCGIKLDKHDRDYFAAKDTHDIAANFQRLMTYCANDVDATFRVAQVIFPEFRRKVPHPVSFAALGHMGRLILPTTSKWDRYVQSAEKVYEDNCREVSRKLHSIAEETRALKEHDVWSSQLNWTTKQPRLKKDGTPYAKQAYLCGNPEWYRDLFKTSTTDEDGTKVREMNLTLKTRITPLLLKLKWEGYPVVWTDVDGWVFQAPYSDEEHERLTKKGYKMAVFSDKSPQVMADRSKMHFRVPHPDGGRRCTSLFSKGFSRYFEDGTITSEYDYVRDIMELNNKGSYWVGNRKRIMSQFVVYEKKETKEKRTGRCSDQEVPKVENFAASESENTASSLEALVTSASPSSSSSEASVTSTVSPQSSSPEASVSSQSSSPEPSVTPSASPPVGFIIPMLCTMGTITRRATENTWLTASSAKASRIGSELKAMIEVPPGYVFVGADVDSEELWIASLVGDSVFGVHGATALGWMTLEGDKNEKTDLHSKTAQIMGISRNDAKVFNYGRIYGAGVKFATKLLMQCNTSLSDEDAQTIARDLYSKTKGMKGVSKFLRQTMGDSGRSSMLYYGGTESVMFNTLESIAYQSDPRTPVLGAAITDALTVSNLNKNEYLTSRINWVIQSSGVDYLHLLTVAMRYLCDTYGVDARLAITVHDELRYLVKEEDRYKAALLLQISNVWTRAMFSEQMGIKELPQSCAFFSEVDIDTVLRKDVNQPCVTPSNPDPIPPGTTLTIRQLLEIGDTDFLKSPRETIVPSNYTPRTPSLGSIRASSLGVEAMARLENSVSQKDFEENDTMLSTINSIKRRGKKTKIDSDVKKSKGKENRESHTGNANTKAGKTMKSSTGKVNTVKASTDSTVKTSSARTVKASTASTVKASTISPGKTGTASTGKSSTMKSNTVKASSARTVKDSTISTSKASTISPVKASTISPGKGGTMKSRTVGAGASTGTPWTISLRKHPSRLSNEVELGLSGTRELEESCGRQWNTRKLKVESVRPVRTRLR